MEEIELKIPPWSKKRKIVVTATLTVFILLSSIFIGLGLYQTGTWAGWVPQAINKNNILKSLLNDAEFVRTVKHQAQLKECENYEKRFRLMYEAPIHLAQVENSFDNCTILMATHPTGSVILITLKREVEQREMLVMRESKDFSNIQTDILSNTEYETSVLTGSRNGVSTTIYVVGIDQNTSWVIEYLPTTPLIDAKVLGMVESFEVF